MEHLLAQARIYLMVIVFFSSCFIGLMSGVSLPMLAVRSMVIVCIVGVLSHLFVRYIVSVSKTVSSAEFDQMHDSIFHKNEHGIDHNTK